MLCSIPGSRGEGSDLHAQQWWQVGFTIQWLLSSCSSLKICDIFYYGPLGQGLLFRATESHPPYGGCDCIHVGDASHLIFHYVAGAHGHQSGDIHHFNSKWPGGHLKCSLQWLVFL